MVRHLAVGKTTSRYIPLLESGDGFSVNSESSHSILRDDVSNEKGDNERTAGEEGGSILMRTSWLTMQLPRDNAKVAHEVGGRGAAGAANFSANTRKHEF